MAASRDSYIYIFSIILMFVTALPSILFSILFISTGYFFNSSAINDYFNGVVLSYSGILNLVDPVINSILAVVAITFLSSSKSKLKNTLFATLSIGFILSVFMYAACGNPAYQERAHHMTVAIDLAVAQPIAYNSSKNLIFYTMVLLGIELKGVNA